jgi:hypothetical protein
MLHAFAYDECDIPAELTIAEFRALRRARPKTRVRFRRLRLGRDTERR